MYCAQQRVTVLIFRMTGELTTDKSLDAHSEKVPPVLAHAPLVEHSQERKLMRKPYSFLL